MQVNNEVLSVLSAARLDGRHLYLVGQLDRQLYTQTNKVLEAAGGKWDRKAKAHIFDAPAADRVDQIILTGSVVIPTDEFNFFPTPPDLAEEVVRLAQIGPGMEVLEPSAGLGALAQLAYARGGKVDCIELMPANADALQDAPFVRALVRADFLSIPAAPRYDRVVMNPPFAKQADIKHVRHALGFMRPGGRLVAIMAAGVVYRSDARTQEFRALLDRLGGTVAQNAAGAFKASGTGVSTVTVVIPA